jgi:multiple sugar transport system substrate-binding protein
VLWYNVKLMKRFGYTVPTTWEQFQALGLTVAKRHPGYVVGNFGDFYSLEGWYWGSGCPLAQLQGASTVHININDPACTRVTKMVDTLLAARALSKEDSFGTGYAKIGQEDKILMMPAASWYPTFLFKPSYKLPSGEIAAAPPLRWSHDKINWTGAQGGASTRCRAIARICVLRPLSPPGWPPVTITKAPLTFPAYLPAADVWAKQLNHNPFFAINPYPVLRATANLIRPTWNYVRYDLHDPFTTTVIAAVENGKTAASATSSFQARLVQAAQQVGYTVVQ